MFRVVATYLILLMTWEVNAQQIPRYTYHDKEKSKLKEIFHVADTFNNVLEGPYLSYHLNGNIESKGQFLNNETVGVWEFYYETGKLKMRGALRNNSNYGVWEYFFENGNKQMEGTIINRRREGPWKIYYESGELKYEGSFNGNKRSGLWLAYYEDGKKQSETEYTADIGNVIEFYHSGEKKAEGHKNGMENTGKWRFFYPSGNLQAEGEFIDGKRTGEWTFYFPEGAVSSKGEYSGDVPAGTWSYFYESGKISAEGNFNKGEKEGVWKAWYDGGSLKSETLYQGDSGLFEEYYETGNLKVTGYLIDGIKHGDWKYYYFDGSLEGEITFNYGRGKYKGYYPDGTLQTSGQIEHDQRVGTWEIYDEEGVLKGYYKPFYESDSIRMSDLLKNANKPVRGNVADYRFGKSKFRYFNSKLNEYQGVILSFNPLFTLMGRLPVAGEFYLQERLGHEVYLEAIRDPFYIDGEDVALNNIYTRGYFISLRQKFYIPDRRFGLFYFGHSLSFTNLEHHINFETDMEGMLLHSALENRYIYSLLGGYRFMKNTDDRGFTMDGWISLGTGYRSFTTAHEESESFEILPQSKVPVDFNFGITFGYSYPFK